VRGLGGGEPAGPPAVNGTARRAGPAAPNLPVAHAVASSAAQAGSKRRATGSAASRSTCACRNSPRRMPRLLELPPQPVRALRADGAAHVVAGLEGVLDADEVPLGADAHRPAAGGSGGVGRAGARGAGQGRRAPSSCGPTRGPCRRSARPAPAPKPHDRQLTKRARHSPALLRLCQRSGAAYAL
jgi:hypothetical protein